MRYAGQKLGALSDPPENNPPGVPGIDQGTEMWDFSLLDPDNHRFVDYMSWHSILQEPRAQTAGAGDDQPTLAIVEFLAHSQSRCC
jgi:maltooligosyltrehalose synthase